MHTPAKMPMAKAESVGMSTEGLSRIDEMMQEHQNRALPQGIPQASGPLAGKGVDRSEEVIHRCVPFL